MDKLVKKLAEGGAEVCYFYEAGPTGIWLCRHLRAQGLFRAGELTEVRVPDEAD